VAGVEGRYTTGGVARAPAADLQQSKPLRRAADLQQSKPLHRAQVDGCGKGVGEDPSAAETWGETQAPHSPSPLHAIQFLALACLLTNRAAGRVSVHCSAVPMVRT
jgi:hypothetical protein